MPVARPYENVRFRDGSQIAIRARNQWKRGGTGTRGLLKVWSRLWLSFGPPVLVPLSEPTAAGKILLHGPGIVARHLLLTGGFEIGETSRYLQFLRPGMVVFDVGANLGVYSLLSAHAIGESGQLHAFEPIPELAGSVRQSLRLSGLSGCVAPAAVSDHRGVARFYTGARVTQSGSHSLARSPKRRGEISVPLLTLDDYIATLEIPRVDVIKLDIEGAELLALKGAARLLSSQRPPLIQAEMYDTHCAPFGHAAADVIRYLSQFGYRAYRRRRQAWLEMKPNDDYGVARNLLFLQERHWELMPERAPVAQRASASSRVLRAGR